MNRLAAWLVFYTAAFAGGIAPLADAHGLDEPSTAASAAQLPMQPPATFRALIGEYGRGDALITIYEAGGGLYADGRGLHQVPLHSDGRSPHQPLHSDGRSPHQPLHSDGSLRYAAEGSGAQGKMRLAFHVNSKGSADALSVNGEEWPRRDVGAETIDAIRSGLRADPAALRAAALGVPPPIEPAPKHPMDLVALSTIDPSIQFDIRYASSNNFMGFPLYDQPAAYLQRPAAAALGRVAGALRSKGYGLLIYDAYRPWFVTKMFWDATPPESRIFVADPAAGSRHNRGCAVDLTLYDRATGSPVDMTSRYDEMSRRAYAHYVGGTSRQRWLRDLLRAEMEKEGFAVYPEEWWHFDYNGWQDYGIGNVTFAELQKAAGG